MSISYNKVILVGRTTRTPEVKMSAELTKVVTFDLAVSRSFGDGETDFFNCVAFGKLADTIASYVGKGELILVEGRIEIDKWVDKSGINREKPKIYVSSFRFLETKSSKEENTNMNENVFEEVKQEEKEMVQDKLFDDFERWLDEFE